MTTQAQTYLNRLESYLGTRYAVNTREAYLGQSRRFLDVVGAKPAYNKMELISYINGLVRGEYRSRSISTIVSGVKAMFDANELHWPLTRRDMHLGMTEDREKAPALERDEVVKLILSVKELDWPYKPALALASVYGPRPSEIAYCLSHGVDGQVLRFPVKRGHIRTHTIPPELRRPLCFPGHNMTRDGLHHAFDRLLSRFVRPPAPGEGWHSIRRSLSTAMNKTGIDHYVFAQFMGWQVQEMPFHYDRTTPAEVDAKVFELHPFLPYWE